MVAWGAIADRWSARDGPKFSLSVLRQTQRVELYASVARHVAGSPLVDLRKSDPQQDRMAESTSTKRALVKELRQIRRDARDVHRSYGVLFRIQKERRDRDFGHEILHGYAVSSVPDLFGRALNTLVAYRPKLRKEVEPTLSAISETKIAGTAKTFQALLGHLDMLLKDLCEKLQSGTTNTPYSDDARKVFENLGGSVFESMDNPAILKTHRANIRRWLGNPKLSDEAIRSLLKRIRDHHGFPSSSQVKKTGQH